MRKLILFGSVTAFLLVCGTVLASDWNRIDPSSQPSARFGHSMVSMPNGSTVLFGGEDVEKVNEDLFLWRTLDWNSVTGDGPEGRTGHTTWIGKGGQYVLGGKGKDGEPLNDFWRFNPTVILVYRSNGIP